MPKEKWSNDVSPPDMIDREIRRLTPHEEQVAALIEKNKDVQPVMCNVTSKNAKAPRVIHDFYGKTVLIPPNETMPGIALHPNNIAYFNGPKSDLVVVAAA